MGVLAYGLRQSHLTVLIGAYLVMVLLVVNRKALYLSLTLLTQYGADRQKQFHYHVLHKVMSLKEQVGVILPDSH